MFLHMMQGDYSGIRIRNFAPAEKLRREIFEPLGDPVKIVEDLLVKNWPGAVTIARHPQTGQKLYAGIIRSGTPRLHCDWMRWDIPGFEAVMQAG
jgi:hypothetical protein